MNELTLNLLIKSRNMHLTHMLTIILPGDRDVYLISNHLSYRCLTGDAQRTIEKGKSDHGRRHFFF